METQSQEKKAEDEIDIEKLRQLAKEDQSFDAIKRTCPACQSELQYCFEHQKAESYLNRFFDRGSIGYEKLYRMHIEG